MDLAGIVPTPGLGPRLGLDDATCIATVPWSLRLWPAGAGRVKHWPMFLRVLLRVGALIGNEQMQAEGKVKEITGEVRQKANE